MRSRKVSSRGADVGAGDSVRRPSTRGAASSGRRSRRVAGHLRAMTAQGVQLADRERAHVQRERRRRGEQPERIHLDAQDDGRHRRPSRWPPSSAAAAFQARPHAALRHRHVEQRRRRLTHLRHHRRRPFVQHDVIGMPVEAVLVEGDDDVGAGAGDGGADVGVQLGTLDPGQEPVAVVEQRHFAQAQLAGPPPPARGRATRPCAGGRMSSSAPRPPRLSAQQRRSECPRAAHRASSPPLASDSSSGWAKTASREWPAGRRWPHPQARAACAGQRRGTAAGSRPPSGQRRSAPPPRRAPAARSSASTRGRPATSVVERIERHASHIVVHDSRHGAAAQGGDRRAARGGFGQHQAERLAGLHRIEQRSRAHQAARPSRRAAPRPCRPPGCPSTSGATCSPIIVVLVRPRAAGDARSGAPARSPAARPSLR